MGSSKFRSFSVHEMKTDRMNWNKIEIAENLDTISGMGVNSISVFKLDRRKYPFSGIQAQWQDTQRLETHEGNENISLVSRRSNCFSASALISG